MFCVFYCSAKCFKIFRPSSYLLYTCLCLSLRTSRPSSVRCAFWCFQWLTDEASTAPLNSDCSWGKISPRLPLSSLVIRVILSAHVRSPLKVGWTSSFHRFSCLFLARLLPSLSVLAFSAVLLPVNTNVNVNFMSHRSVGVWKVSQLQLKPESIHCDSAACTFMQLYSMQGLEQSCSPKCPLLLFNQGLTSLDQIWKTQLFHPQTNRYGNLQMLINWNCCSDGILWDLGYARLFN